MRPPSRIAFTAWENTQGENNRTSKLTDDKAREIRKAELTPEQLAKKFGVTHETIRLIQVGKTWKHVK